MQGSKFLSNLGCCYIVFWWWNKELKTIKCLCLIYKFIGSLTIHNIIKPIPYGFTASQNNGKFEGALIVNAVLKTLRSITLTRQNHLLGSQANRVISYENWHGNWSWTHKLLNEQMGNAANGNVVVPKHICFYSRGNDTRGKYLIWKYADRMYLLFVGDRGYWAVSLFIYSVDK